MKLWLVTPRAGEEEVGAWDPWYDKCFGFVIRAKTEEDARRMADEQAGDENCKHIPRRPWLDPNQSHCKELTAEGEPSVIIRDMHSA